MNKLLEKLARKILCPLNIHIKTGHCNDYIFDFDYCKLCHKERYNKKWIVNPY